MKLLKLKILLKQKLNISHKLIQSLEILSMPISELDDFLKEESQENVMLEFSSKFDNPKYVLSLQEKYSSINNNVDDLSFDNFLSEPETLKDYLILQLLETNLSEEIVQSIKFLVLNLDDNGYLKVDLPTASNSLKVKLSVVEEAHKILMSFDPKGIGARNLKECLLAQIPDTEDLLYNMIDNHLEDIANNRADMIMDSLKINREEYLNLLGAVKSLNPKPGASFYSEKTIEYVIPDVFVSVDNGLLQISVDTVNEVHLNQHYLSLLERNIDKETEKYLKEKLSRSLMIIKSVDRRNETIKAISEYLINYQKDFFVSSLPLKTITQKDIADEFSISISTVSRAVKNKYVQTPKGSFPLKKLFTNSIAGNLASKDYIKKLILTFIETEDKSKPYSDEVLKNKLTDMGINIKRRTVQKYREELNIKSSVKRKQI